MTTEVAIELARVDDVVHVPAIEARAALLFAPEDLPVGGAEQTLDHAEVAAAQAAGRLLVARTADGVVVGFALLELDGDAAHLQELDVDPDFGRRGIGRALVEAAIDRAGASGATRLTLSTFRDVAWNAPFYARCGFEVVPREAWTDADRARREAETNAGLDGARRVIMARSVVRPSA